jgi:hypothetical protein
MAVKKSFVAMAAAVAALAGLHQLAPSLRRRAMQQCHELVMRSGGEPPCEAGCAAGEATTT